MDEIDWEEWFNAQWELNDRIDRAITGLSKGKDDAYKAALWSSVIEHAAEQIRNYIPPTPK